MSFHIRSDTFSQLALAIERQRFCDGGGGRCINLDVGSGQDAKGLGAAVAGDEGCGAGRGNRLRRLDACALRRIHILLIVGERVFCRLRIIDQERRCSSEATVYWGS